MEPAPSPLCCWSWAPAHGKGRLSSTMLLFCGQGWILTPLPTCRMLPRCLCRQGWMGLRTEVTSRS